MIEFDDFNTAVVNSALLIRQVIEFGDAVNKTTFFLTADDSGTEKMIPVYTV